MNKCSVLVNLINKRYDRKADMAELIANLESSCTRLETIGSKFEDLFKVAVLVS